MQPLLRPRFVGGLSWAYVSLSGYGSQTAYCTTGEGRANSPSPALVAVARILYIPWVRSGERQVRGRDAAKTQSSAPPTDHRVRGGPAGRLSRGRRGRADRAVRQLP